ncbi:6317_t:CDS:2, partial [Acaulospora colombiana]
MTLREVGRIGTRGSPSRDFICNLSNILVDPSPFAIQDIILYSTLTERNAIRKELNDPNHSLTLRRPHLTLRPATVLPSTKEPALAEVVQ